MHIFKKGQEILNSNRPINFPQDLKGMILRVPNVPLFVNYWQAAGAKSTPMAFLEVFTGLQQSTIEGQENPLALIYSANFFEIQKYVNFTEHVISWVYVVIDNKKLKSLSEDLQAIIIDAGKKLQDKLLEKGMSFNAVDKAQFQAIAKK